MTVGQDKSKIAREWITFSLAVIACVLSMVSYYETSKNTKKTEIIRSNNILDKAWDIMGGQPGTTTIVSFETDHHKMELARRLIQQVLSRKHFFLSFHHHSCLQSETALLVQETFSLCKENIVLSSCHNFPIHPEYILTFW